MRSFKRFTYKWKDFNIIHDFKQIVRGLLFETLTYVCVFSIRIGLFEGHIFYRYSFFKSMKLTNERVS